MECWKRNVGVVALGYRGTLRACRCGCVEVWSSRALEGRCRCSDVDAWRYGSMDVWKRDAGVATRRYGVLEAQCRCSGVRVSRYAAGMQMWMRGGMELESSG